MLCFSFFTCFCFLQQLPNPVHFKAFFAHLTGIRFSEAKYIDDFSVTRGWAALSPSYPIWLR